MSKTALAYAPGQSSLLRANEIKTIRAEQEAQERVDTARGIAERKALPTGSDIAPEVATRHRFKPAQRLDGLDFLASQKVLSASKYQAGRIWSVLYVMLLAGNVKSCLGAEEVRGQIAGMDANERRVYARLKLKFAEQALNGHAGMISALNAVCGEGKRPAELSSDRRANERAVSFLDCALTVLAKHWGV